MKEYTSKIFLYNQNNLEPITETDMKELDEKIENTKHEIEDLRNENKVLISEYKNITSSITNEQLNIQLIESRKEVENLIKKFNEIETRKVQAIPDDKVKEAEKQYNDNLNKYKKLKRVSNNILENFSEAFEKKKMEIFVNNIVLILGGDKFRG
jgi:hypothetical protein